MKIYLQRVLVIGLVSLSALAFSGCSSVKKVRRLSDPFTSFLFNESSAQETKTRKLMLIGDSWAQFMTGYHTFDQLLEEFGYDQYYCGSTALVGTKASQWGSRAGQAFLRTLLRKRQETKIVILTIGGNDFIAAYKAGQSAATREKNWNRIAGNVRKILKAITEARPDMRVVILGYTHLNLVESLNSTLTDANDRYYRRLGRPTPAQVNGAMAELSLKIKEVTDEFEAVAYVQNMGLLQYVYGLPKHDIKPRQVPYPGSAPTEYLPFPGGRVDLPAPPEAMFKLPNFIDSIHLSGEAYYYVAKNTFYQYIDDWLRAEAD